MDFHLLNILVIFEFLHISAFLQIENFDVARMIILLVVWCKLADTSAWQFFSMAILWQENHQKSAKVGMSCNRLVKSATRKWPMLVPTSAWVYRSNVGMLFLKVLNANIGFILLLKYWGLAPPGEWNVMSMLNNAQIAFVIIHFRDIFSLFNISNIRIFWPLILTRVTYINNMLGYNSSLQIATYIIVWNYLITTILLNI